MKLRLLFVVLAAAVASACFDFVDPDFPEADAPAVLQATVQADESGHIAVDAQLAPGLQIGGMPRTVRPDTLVVNGLALAPKEIKKNGTRVYAFDGTAARIPQELLLQGPRVEEVVAAAPRADWFAVVRTDPDTIVWQRGTELVLHLRTNLGTSTPAPQIRQWFLDLTGSDRQFRISSDGLPPDSLRIPAEWVPASTSGRIPVSLSFYQTGRQQSPPGDYIGLISFTFQIHWLIRVTAQ